MKDSIRKLQEAFSYCGLTRREYLMIRKDAYISNFMVWKYLHVMMIVGYAIMMVFSTQSHGMNPIAGIYMAMIGYSAAVSLLFIFVFERDSLLAQFIIYLSMILLLLSTLLSGLYQPDSVAVGFIVMLVILPMFMIDKPYFMAILLTAAVIVFLMVEETYIEPETYHTDRLNALFYGLLGIIINVFYNHIRFHDFKLQRQEMNHILEQQQAAAETQKLNDVLKKMSESTVDLLGDVVEGRDLESGEHIQRVKGFTYLLALQVMKDLPEYGLDKYTVDLITFTSALHDVGKISIPDAILCKPGKLTPEEYEIMKTHCEKGCKIIGKMTDKWSQDYLDMGMAICLNHHEKWDGKGYPHGLKGDEIPIGAQIVSIADIYDALTSRRVYKDAYTYEKSYRMIMDGECGAFSDKLLACFTKCKERFEAYAKKQEQIEFKGHEYEIISNAHPEQSFVIGLHDQNRTLQERIRLREEVSVMGSLAEEFLYVCYVNMQTNEVTRFKADTQFTRILESFGDGMRSNEKFDKLLNSIIVSEDYQAFRDATERKKSVAILEKAGHLSTDFRIRLDDGVHYCRMKIALDLNNKNAVIIGISRRDEEHEKEMAYISMQQQLDMARQEIENQEKLADRLAVIDCISSEYDYVCSLNADTMEVTVYRAAPWIQDMFKNLKDIVASPVIRNSTLKGIIHPDDFEQFQTASRHENVLIGLHRNGTYQVNYRAYKYGELIDYETRYAIDRNDPKRIVIGLHSVQKAESASECRAKEDIGA